MHLFNGHQNYLSYCLAGEKGLFRQTLKSGLIESLAPGILLFTPHTSTTQSPALVLSAGIHGNETAPIELLNNIIMDIVNETLPVAMPILMILGNLEAMKAQTRFIENNLNRLFTQDILSDTTHEQNEPARARELMLMVNDFKNRNSEIWHYDLHTAIRSSAIEKFALYPFVKDRDLPAQQKDFLKSAGVEAIVLQDKLSTTFSSYSSSALQAESFTIELGQVKPFGENDLSRLSALDLTLRQLISGKDSPVTDSQQHIQTFEACHEIINTGESFKLHIPEDASNFTAYAQGTLIWEDESKHYRVQAESEYILFPNSKVKKGERAGLLVQPCSKVEH